MALEFDPENPDSWMDEDPFGAGPGGYDRTPRDNATAPVPPPAAAPQQFEFGSYGNSAPLGWEEAPAGDPRYNEAQKGFEANTDWGWLENELRREAGEREIDYDPSDLMDIQRNAGYDAAHRGSGQMYGQGIQKWLDNAVAKYDERATNTPGGDQAQGGSGGSNARAGGQGAPGSGWSPPPVSRTNYSGPGGAGVTSGPVQQVGEDPFSQLITNSIGGILENAGRLDPERMALRQEASRSVLDRQRKGQLAQNRGELADRNLLSVPGIPQGTDIASIMRTDERFAPAYADAARDVVINEQDLSEDRLSNAMGLGTARQAMMGKLALDALSQNMEWNMFLANLGLSRDQLMYEIQNNQMDNVIPLVQLFSQMVQTSASGRV